jgi:hypothetical protein
MKIHDSVTMPPRAPVIAAPTVNATSPEPEPEELVSDVGIAVMGGPVGVERLTSAMDESHGWVLHSKYFSGGTMPWSAIGGLKERDLFMPDIENRFEKLTICMLVLALSVDTIPRKLERGCKCVLAMRGESRVD